MSFELSADNELYYRLEGRETVDVDAYEMLRHNDVHHMLPPLLSQLDDDRTLSYATEGLTPASDFLAGHVVNTQALITILSGANEAFIEAREYMLEPSSFAGSLYYLYLDDRLYTRLAYVPILGYVGCVGEREFLNDLFVHMRYDMATGDRDTLLAIHEALRQDDEDEFSPLRFRKLLSALRLGRRPGEYVTGFLRSQGDGADAAPQGAEQGDDALDEPSAGRATPAAGAVGAAAAAAVAAEVPGTTQGRRQAAAGRAAAQARPRADAAGSGASRRRPSGAQRDAAPRTQSAAVASIMGDDDAASDVTTTGSGRFDGMAIPGPAAAAAGMMTPSGGIDQGDADKKKDKESKADKDAAGKGGRGLFGRRGGDASGASDAADAGQGGAGDAPARRGLFGRKGKGTEDAATQDESAVKQDDATGNAPARRGLFGRGGKSSSAADDTGAAPKKDKGARAQRKDGRLAKAESARPQQAPVAAADAPAAKDSHGFVPYAAAVLLQAAVGAALYYLIGNTANPAETVRNILFNVPVVLLTVVVIQLVTSVVRLVVTYGLMRDVGVACAGDGKGSAPNIVLFVLLGLLTLGIYAIVQRVRVGARIKANAAGFGCDFGLFGGAFVLVCELVGIFTLGIGSVVGMFFLVRNGDALIGAYNALRGE